MRGASIIAAILTVAVSAYADGIADPTVQAKEHFVRGTALYDAGKYAEAATQYLQAFRLSDRPGFLFNIGQAYRLGKKPKEALDAYREFLRRDPKAFQKAEVDQYIVELEREVAPTPTIVEAATAIIAPPPERKPLYKKWWLWTIVGGVVVAGAATGIAIGVTQSNRTRGFEFPKAPVMP